MIETSSQPARDALTRRLATLLDGLMSAVPALHADAPTRSALQAIVDRGLFRPAENERLAHWFARFLSQREALWAIINDVDATLDVPLRRIQTTPQWRLFLLGYAAACLLVRQDRVLLTEVATHTLIQRKLNEAFPEYGIVRKRYSAIFEGFTDPLDALQLHEAMRVVRARRRELLALGDDPVIAPVVTQLAELESWLQPSKRLYFRRLLTFLLHRWRRRGASATQQTVFAVLEGFGRTASHLDPGRNRKKVTPAICREAAGLLQPGDVIVSRHRYALTNYLLPGNWPHASLYVGTPAQRDTLGVKLDSAIADRWRDEKCTLEALRDGVKFRPLSETLRVDCFVIIRPRLDRAGVREALERVVKHEGKGYNFDFDFFTSDKLVCTEVIYRAFDGVQDFSLPLTERAGRQTLSAEELLDLAIDQALFEPVAIFGYPDGHEQIVMGELVRPALIASYRATR